jgi:hypothetical protein
MRKYIKVYRSSERDFGGKLNLIDNFSVDYIRRFSLDTFVCFENEERTVLLTTRKSSNNHNHEAWPFFIKIYFQRRKLPCIFRTHRYIVVLTGICCWIYLRPDESSSPCHPRIKSERKYLFHTVNAKGSSICYILVPIGPNINNDKFAFYYIPSAHSSWGQTFIGTERHGILYNKPVMNFYIQDLFVCAVCPEGTYLYGE